MIETALDSAEVVLRLQVLDTLHKLALDSFGTPANTMYEEALVAFRRDYPQYFS